MQRACTAWLAAWRWPENGLGLLTPDGLRSIMRTSYLSGYEAGRESARPLKAPPH